MSASEKPGKGNRIFISTVSGEFEKTTAAFPGLRSKLRHYLTAADCEVKVQEDFRRTHGGTLEKLFSGAPVDTVRRLAAQRGCGRLDRQRR